MKLSLQSRYQVRSSIGLLTYIVFTFLPLVNLSSAMETRSLYWALVCWLYHHLASGRLLISFKGPTNWRGRMHTGQSSGHLRYGLNLQMLALYFNYSSGQAGRVSSHRQLPRLSTAFHYLIQRTTSRTLQSGMITSANADEPFSNSASSPAYRARTSSIPPS
jgi:hypothetical protein